MPSGSESVGRIALYRDFKNEPSTKNYINNKGGREGDGESPSWMPAAGSGDGQVYHRTP